MIAIKGALKIGDKVEWESQAAGSTLRKVGVVFKVIPINTYPRAGDFYPDYRTCFDGWGRNHESYLIEVPGGKTQKAKPKLYWPRVSLLRKKANP